MKSIRFKRFSAVFALTLLAALPVRAAYNEDGEEDDPENAPWKELSVNLPAYPDDKNLIEFEVGPTNKNHFYVDPTSLVVGNDGVVRFTLVVRTPGGANNVSFEGMRCDTKEDRIIAIGRADRTWYPLPRPEWRPVENRLFNQHHVVLFRQYFCPEGNIIRTPADGVKLLKKGGFSQ